MPQASLTPVPLHFPDGAVASAMLLWAKDIDVLLDIARQAGPAFLRCHSRTTASLHKGIHNTSRVNPVSATNRQHMTARWNKGLKTATCKQQGRVVQFQLLQKQLRSQAGRAAVHTHFNVSAVTMETSISDPSAWTHTLCPRASQTHQQELSKEPPTAGSLSPA
ncbi:TPA: hypothetical protein ACH3X1_013421 [Trebouxia sp. C0004]